jgi:hypothetical protein
LAFDYNEPLKVASKYLKSASLAAFYDEVLIPALVLAEKDRHAGLLNDEQEQFVREAAGDLVDELGQVTRETSRAVGERQIARTEDHIPRAQLADERTFTEARILCIPLRDEADETAAAMLVQLLKSENFDVVVEGAESLTSELVERVAQSASDLVVISILPPIAPRDSRLLWKRLRSRYPELPIIVGFWNSAAAKETLVPPEHDAASKVATTLAEAVALVRSTAAQLQRSTKDSARETRSAG